MEPKETVKVHIFYVLEKKLVNNTESMLTTVTCYFFIFISILRFTMQLVSRK